MPQPQTPGLAFLRSLSAANATTMDGCADAIIAQAERFGISDLLQTAQDHPVAFDGHSFGEAVLNRMQRLAERIGYAEGHAAAARHAAGTVDHTADFFASLSATRNHREKEENPGVRVLRLTDALHALGFGTGFATSYITHLGSSAVDRVVQLSHACVESNAGGIADLMRHSGKVAMQAAEAADAGDFLGAVYSVATLYHLQQRKDELARGVCRRLFLDQYDGSGDPYAALGAILRQCKTQSREAMKTGDREVAAELMLIHTLPITENDVTAWVAMARRTRRKSGPMR